MDYKTVSGITTSEFTVSRSRFLTFIAEVDTVDSGLNFVRGIKKKYQDATHVCYAIYAPDGEKSSDDGEPKSTAGQPMLSVLKKQNIKATATVVRWFGGVKLGAGGLVEAYTKSVAEVLLKAEKVFQIESAIIKISVDYKSAQAVKTTLKTSKVLNETYNDGAEFTVGVPLGQYAELLEKLKEVTSGTARTELMTKEYQTYFTEGNI